MCPYYNITGNRILLWKYFFIQVYNLDKESAQWWNKSSEFRDSIFWPIVATEKYNVNNQVINYFSTIIINNIYPMFSLDSIDEESYWKTPNELFHNFMSRHGVDIMLFLNDNLYILNKKYLTNILVEYVDTNKYWSLTTFKELMEWKPCQISSNVDIIKKWCMEVIGKNEKTVSDYKNGKKNAINSLKGQVMKLSSGKADITVVSTMLEELLNNKL